MWVLVALITRTRQTVAIKVETKTTPIKLPQRKWWISCGKPPEISSARQSISSRNSCEGFTAKGLMYDSISSWRFPRQSEKEAFKKEIPNITQPMLYLISKQKNYSKWIFISKLISEWKYSKQPFQGTLRISSRKWKI